MKINYKPLTIIISLVFSVSAVNAANTLTDEQIKLNTEAALNQSDVGLVSKTHADGTVSMDLKGRFQMHSKLVIDANGKQKFICNTHPNADYATHSHNSQPIVTEKPTTEMKRVAR